MCCNFLKLLKQNLCTYIRMKTNERLYKWHYSLLYVLRVQTLYVSAISESAIKCNNIIYAYCLQLYC